MRSAMLEALTLTTETDAAGGARPAVWPAAAWVAHFRRNAATLPPLPWADGVPLSDAERDTVIASLRAWQLGETSDGAHLLKTAERYAARNNDPDYAEAMRLFIAEEQRHGATLGGFLDSVGVPRKQRDWSDALFRACRHLLTRVETNTSVILMAEVHALVYYAAVGRATASPVLRAVCRQLLRDEVPHIRFQCERLAILHRRRPRALHALTMAGHRAFFAALTVGIWAGHRRALRAGGFTFGRFWRAAWGKMRAAWAKADPRAYHWPD